MIRRRKKKASPYFEIERLSETRNIVGIDESTLTELSYENYLHKTSIFV